LREMLPQLPLLSLSANGAATHQSVDDALKFLFPSPAPLPDPATAFASAKFSIPGAQASRLLLGSLIEAGKMPALPGLRLRVFLFCL
ncbi:MAG: hypothetical protein K2X27_10750, partial [Candidatus Obscuribacterales bacterium]|nr:hypothetical protein [Candidatus Obscuribacterales bacterium]